MSADIEDACREIDAENRALRTKYEAVQAKNNALLHELERLRSITRDVVKVARSEPALTVYCDAPGCCAPPISIKVAPPEDAIPLWVRGMGWGYTADGEGYLCQEHVL